MSHVSLSLDLVDHIVVKTFKTVGSDALSIFFTRLVSPINRSIQQKRDDCDTPATIALLLYLPSRQMIGNLCLDHHRGSLPPRITTSSTVQLSFQPSNDDSSILFNIVIFYYGQKWLVLVIDLVCCCLQLYFQAWNTVNGGKVNRNEIYNWITFSRC